MSVRRNNHFVPQMYLQNWGTDNKVFVHRLLVPHELYPDWERCSIRKTAYIENLYVRIEDGEEYDDFEIDFNSQFETPTKPVLDKICNDCKLKPEDWQILCDYITAQYVRTPSFYSFVAEWGKENVPHTIDSIFEELKNVKNSDAEKPYYDDNKVLLPVEMEVSLNQNDKQKYLVINTVIGKNLWLFTINHALLHDSPIKKTVRSLKWSIISAPIGIAWPTCDAPVVITRLDKKHNLFITDGFGYRDRVILFPVSPKKVLWGSQKREIPWRLEADENLTIQIRGAIVGNAHMYIYSNTEDADVIAIRDRSVDEKVFQEQKEQFNDWYKKYRNDEAPLLTRKRNIMGTT